MTPGIRSGTEQPLLVDHYSIERVLGTGAMGVVYLARDVRINRLVALKTLQKSSVTISSDLASAQHFERFRREAELCGSLVHPNIVTLYEVGYENRRFTYLAMEFVDGESLMSLMRRQQRLDLRSCLRIVDDVLQGLAYAHERGVIHRDIKPANILLSLTGQVKVTDFGVARSDSATDDLSVRGQLLGTPHYMAPEHVAGKTIDGRSDLFSVGVMMYEMLSGKKPFDGIGLTDVLFNIVHQPTPRLAVAAPGTPPWCCDFVHRLLEKSPENRFATAAEASAELRRLLLTQLEQPWTGNDTVGVRVARELRADETPTTPITPPAFAAPKLPEPPAAAPDAALHRHIPLRVALPILVLQVALVLLVVTRIGRQIDDTPSVIFTPAELAEFETRETMMAEATLLYNAGAWDHSIRAYDAYLMRYPWSPAAREGRARAIAARMRAEETAREATTTTVPRQARVAMRADHKPDADRTPPSLWQRIKRFFRRG